MAYIFDKIKIQNFRDISEPATRRSQFLGLAHLAEMSYRFDDMALFMNEVVQCCKEGPDLNLDERHLFSVAFKNVVGSRRSAWRAICGEDQAPPATALVICSKLEDEINRYCFSVLDLLENVLLRHPMVTDDSVIFYRKMCADYYRYLTEYALDDNLLVIYKDLAAEYYQEAYDLATKVMQPAEPIRLGLVLNFSIFQHEMMDQREEACNLAKKAYDDAINRLSDSDKDNYKDTRLILNMLRDNLSLWNQPSVENV